MSVKRRVMLAMSANAFGQVITIFSQLFLTPLFFSSWGPAQYGEWLLLSTIPAYFSLADFGLGSAAANEMSIYAASNEKPAAQRTFRGILRICKYISLLITVVAIAFALTLYLKYNFFDLSTISGADAAKIVVLFGLNVGLSLHLGIIAGGFRCDGRNATGIFVGNAFRLIEVILTGVLLASGQSPLAICTYSLIIRLTHFILTLAWLRHICPWLFTPFVDPDITLIKRLMRPSLAFMAFPLGNSLALQGPILIIGFLFGPAMVATFSAMRTLARIPYQITFAFSSSISPEMTFAYGARNFKLLRKLHRKSWALNTIAVSIVALTIGFFGESIVHIWLRKTIVFDALILNGLLVTTFMLSLWNSSSMVLMSSNKHSELAKYYLISNVLGFFISYTLSALTNISGLIVSLVFVEMVLLFTALPLALIVSDDSFGRFFKGMNFSQRKTQIR